MKVENDKRKKDENREGKTRGKEKNEEKIVRNV